MRKFVFISSVKDFDLPIEIKAQALDDTPFIVWVKINGKAQFVGRYVTRKDALIGYKKEKAK